MEPKPAAQPPQPAQKSIDGVVPPAAQAPVDTLPQGAVFTEVPSDSVRSEVGVHGQSDGDVPIEYNEEQAGDELAKPKSKEASNKKTRPPKKPHSGGPTGVIVIATIFLLALVVAAYLAYGSIN